MTMIQHERQNWRGCRLNSRLSGFDRQPHESLSHRMAMHWPIPPATEGRTAGRAREAARAWIVERVQAGDWPELRAAHLVGGITALEPDAPFPAGKDVDLHLIFSDDSPMLAHAHLGFAILEEPFAGYALEAGLKSRHEYRSAATVLANPEIAYHLTVDSILYDPEGLLHSLQPKIRRDYARRSWVLARLEHERRGLAGAHQMRDQAREMWGASGEVNLLGYSVTFVTAAVQVAALQPPRIGARVFLHFREALAEQGRLDLYESFLDALGLTRISQVDVERFLREASAAFDQLVVIREARPGLNDEFGPFQHKLHGHLRAYLVETCCDLLAEGYPREAMGWVVPYHLATADQLLVHGPEAERPAVAARQMALLRALGLETDAERDAAVERVQQIAGRIFALAEEVIARHPGIRE